MQTNIASLDPATAAPSVPRRRVPLWTKLAYTAFMAVLVPVYWANYGVTNFLYFCDVALFLALVAVWRESRLLTSIAAVGILAPQMVWVVDFLGQFAGLKLTGMTDYMFDTTRSRFLRGLSLFHGWLPFLLLFLVKRLGYDRRGFKVWTVLATGLMLFCYFFLPMPGDSVAGPHVPVNVNYVHGLSDTAVQTWMPAPLWLLTLIVGMPLLLSGPAHLFLKWFSEKFSNEAPTNQPPLLHP